MNAELADALAVAALATARRFADGASLWCVSERWPAHARHVAVEFVHPVIVGKRALPAVQVEAAHPVDAVRLLARPGDVLVVIAGADDTLASSLVRRAAAWGLTSLWIGAGEDGPPGRADQELWLAEVAADEAARNGQIVMIYHLLWELLHVAFEHPGLLKEGPQPCEGATCITCSDEGRLAEITSIDRAGNAQAVAAGQQETIDVSLVSPVEVGDLVLVHAGVAITRLEESLR